MKISNSYPKVSKEQINRFERESCLSLPEDYKKFILENNGGEPDLDCIDIPDWDGSRTALSKFFGIETNNADDLKQILTNVVDILPKKYLPFAEDSGGNLFCLDLSRGKTNGKIIFWDHHASVTESIYNVCDNFKEFISKLYKPNE